MLTCLYQLSYTITLLLIVFHSLFCGVCDTSSSHLSDSLIAATTSATYAPCAHLSPNTLGGLTTDNSPP